VVKHIRENITREAELNELDIKIALLVKNQISLEEVVHLTSKRIREKEGEENHGNSFSLKALDKESRARLELYQNLFYLLQTQPIYLAKTMFSINKKSGSAFNKTMEGVVLALYGYAQNTREEYLLLNFIKVKKSHF